MTILKHFEIIYASNIKWIWSIVMSFKWSFMTKNSKSFLFVFSKKINWKKTLWIWIFHEQLRQIAIYVFVFSLNYFDQYIVESNSYFLFFQTFELINRQIKNEDFRVWLHYVNKFINELRFFRSILSKFVFIYFTKKNRNACNNFLIWQFLIFILFAIFERSSINWFFSML